MVTNGNGKNGVGRPKKPVDWQAVEKLCAIQCSEQEIADFLHISVDTLTRRLHDEKGLGFAEFFTKHRVAGKIALRRNLFQLAQKQGHVAIFLAQNWLGMSTKSEIGGLNGAPIPVDIDPKDKLLSAINSLAERIGGANQPK